MTLTLLLGILLAAVGSATRPAPTPCYVIVTAIVSTPDPYTIRRVVTTGIHRYEDAGGGSPSYCTPIAGDGAARAQRAVDFRVRDAFHAGSIEHVVVQSTSPDVAGAHLLQIVAKSRSTAGSLEGVEVVPVERQRGQAADSVSLPALHAESAARAACIDQNAALRRANAAFYWAC